MSLTTKVVRGDGAERLMVLMHGLGSNENDLAALAPYIDAGGRYVIVCPRAPYAFGPGFAWFKMDSPELQLPTMQSSVDAVDEVIDAACDQYGLRREEMILGGFSMGGAMTLASIFSAGRSAVARPAGGLVMSGFLASDPAMLDWTGTLPPVLMQHGTVDPMVPIDRARMSANALRDNGVPLVFREYPMEHNVTPESLADVATWLDQVHAGQAPSEETAPPPPPPPDEGPVKTVTAATFDEVVLRSTKPVIVDFWAPWCGPCRAVAPVIAQIASMREGSYLVVKLNIDEAPDIAQRYDVQSIPLIGMFRNGKLERKSLGAKPRQQLEAELGMLVIP